LAALDAADEAERQRILVTLDRLAAHPEQPFDFQERGLSGEEV
jgi:hypothetical protein